jgi:hypothetical protein
MAATASSPLLLLFLFLYREKIKRIKREGGGSVVRPNGVSAKNATCHFTGAEKSQLL